MAHLNGIDLIFLVVYFAGVLWIGYYTTKKVSGFDDYAVAGRNIPMALLFATIAATLTGGGATIGRVAYVYKTGIVIFVGVLGVVTSQIVIGQFIAPRIREMKDVYTVGDIMGYFYGKSGRFLSSIISFAYCVSIFGVQVLAMGRILQTVTGLPLIPMTIVASVITVAYTWGGGMLAVIYTDAIQFIILAIGITTAALISVNSAGGMDAIVSKIAEISPQTLSFTADWPVMQIIGFFLAFMLGEAIAPYFIQRYVSTKSARDSKWGVTLFGVYYGFITIVTMAIGLVGLIVLPDTNPDLIFSTIVRNYLPVGVTGVVFGGLIAAVMSTGDSILNTAAVVFTRDIYQGFINPNADDKTMLKWSKYATLFVGAGGIFVALLIPSVFDLMIYTFKLWAPSMIPPIVIALLWGKTLERKVSQYAGVPAVICGMVATIIWLSLNEPNGFPALIVGILVNIVVLFTVHVLTKNKKTSSLDEIAS